MNGGWRRGGRGILKVAGVGCADKEGKGPYTGKKLKKFSTVLLWPIL